MRHILTLIFLLSIFSVNAQLVDKCGNNIVDAGENCNNCPQDVICKEDEACLNNRCTIVRRESNLSTIIIIIVIIGLLTAIAALIYILKKKKGYGLIGKIMGGKEKKREEIKNFYKEA